MKTYKTKDYTITITGDVISFWKDFNKFKGMGYNNPMHSFRLAPESIPAFIEMLNAELENESGNQSST